MSSTIRVVFLGTPDFSRHHLASLIDDPQYSVVGVISQPDRPSGRKMHLTPSPVKQLALDRGLRVITPETIKNEETLREIKSWGADAAIVVAYGQILPQTFLDIFPGKVVNVHASLLPRWRGAAPIQRAIEAGDIETGVSLQLMVKKLDAGDVIASYRVKIDESWDAQRLHDELMPLGVRLLRVDFLKYLRGDLVPTPQDEKLVTYAHKIEKSEAQIDWNNKTATQIRNHIRAMILGPGSATNLNGRALKILSGEVVHLTDTSARNTPGNIVAVGNDSFTVACREGALRITRVQPESKSPMSAHDFLLGYKLKVGDRVE